MFFRTAASSSSGNCTVVWDGDKALLVDAGVSMRRIAAALRLSGLSPEALCAVLVTHEHTDHIAGLGMLAKYYQIPILASSGTAAGILRVHPGTEGLIKTVRPGSELELEGFAIRTFPTPHDVPESMGCRVTRGGRSLAVVTDLGVVTREVYEAVRGVNAALVEANHDVQMLKCGPYPPQLKRRILSDRGHLSNKMGGSLAASLAAEGADKLVLAHLSRHNNTPALALEASKKKLEEEGISPERDVLLTVAPPDDPGEVYEV